MPQNKKKIKFFYFSHKLSDNSNTFAPIFKILKNFSLERPPDLPFFVCKVKKKSFCQIKQVWKVQEI